MRDDFVGNIGDYGKYGLMRALTGIYPQQQSRLSLGVIWYRTDRKRSRSGNFDYLGQKDKYEDCDPDLFSVMREIDDNSRRLELIEASRILGGDSRFFYDRVPTGEPERGGWFESALSHVQTQDMILLDPDTGLKAAGGVPSTREASIDEVRRVIDVGKVAIVYHHHEGFPMQHRTRRFAERLRGVLRHDVPPEAVLFSPGRTDFFIVLPERRRDVGNNDLVLERVRDLVNPHEVEWAKSGYFMSRLGDKTPREAVDGGLELVRDGLVDYYKSIERDLKVEYTKPWQKDVRKRISSRVNRNKRTNRLLYSYLGKTGEQNFDDPIFLLDALRQFVIDRVGQPVTLSKSEFLAVRDRRNEWAHFDDIDAKRASTALSVMEKVLRELGDVPRQGRLNHLHQLFKQEML